MIDWGNTERGFGRGDFRDHNGDACSVQLSSAAATFRGQEVIHGPFLWLGCDGNRMHLTQEQAAELSRVLALFARTGQIGPG